MLMRGDNSPLRMRCRLGETVVLVRFNIKGMLLSPSVSSSFTLSVSFSKVVSDVELTFSLSSF